VQSSDVKIMGDKVHFATIEAGASSTGFNGFSVPILERDEDGNSFTLWDGQTYVNDEIGFFSPFNTVGYGTSFPFGFSLDKLVEFFWRRKAFYISEFSMGWEYDLGYAGRSVSRRGVSSTPAQIANGSSLSSYYGNDPNEPEPELYRQFPLTSFANPNPWGLPPNEVSVSFDVGEGFDFDTIAGESWDAGAGVWIDLGVVRKVEGLYYPIIMAGARYLSLFGGRHLVQLSSIAQYDSFESGATPSGSFNIDGTSLPLYREVQTFPYEGPIDINLTASASSSVGAFGGADIFYPYANKDGQPVWNEETGAQVNPLL